MTFCYDDCDMCELFGKSCDIRKLGIDVMFTWV